MNYRSKRSRNEVPRYKEARSVIISILYTCFTMRIVQRNFILLIIVYVFIDSGYTQTDNDCRPKFLCDNGECVDSDLLCDGKADCKDLSDETESLCEIILCPTNAFRCNYGACVHENTLCNGIRDCVDNSDETQCEIRNSTSNPSQQSTMKPTLGNSCRAPPQPTNGRWQLYRSQCPSGQDCSVSEGTELGLGSHLVYSCNSGYKIRGSIDVSCSFEGTWLNIPDCIEIRCRGLTTASVYAKCRHNGAWKACETPVPPGTTAELSCQNSYQPETNILSGQRRNVICNRNGEWEPEPMRCIPVCGTLPFDGTPTIVGGTKPNTTEFPWHATLYLGESKKFFCGASIIQENLLITAAHCVHDENTRQLINASLIYVLTGNIFRDYNYFHNRLIVKDNQVKRIYIQRHYLGFIGNYDLDIAILELVRPFVLSSSLVPVCLDTLNDRNVIEVGSIGKVAGFGRTALSESSAVLQALTVPIISFSQCRSVSQSSNTLQFLTNNKFCAGYRNGSSVCDGDSGGGLVLKTDNLWYLRGIVSVSLGTTQKDGSVYCDNNLYSLYTEVSAYIFWIQEVITRIEQNLVDVLCAPESQTRCS